MTQHTPLTGPHIKTDTVRTLPRRRRPPGPRENWLLGSARTIQRDPLGYTMSMFQRYGNVVAVRFLIWPTYMIFHPHDVKHVLQENHRNYSKDTYLMHFLSPCLARDSSPTTGSPGCTSGVSCSPPSIASSLPPLAR